MIPVKALAVALSPAHPALLEYFQIHHPARFLFHFSSPFRPSARRRRACPTRDIIPGSAAKYNKKSVVLWIIAPISVDFK